MQDSNQGTIDALLEELANKDGHIKQVPARDFPSRVPLLS